MESPSVETLRTFSPYRRQRRRIAALAVVACLAGLAETGAVIAIVSLLDGISRGDLSWSYSVLGVNLSFGRTGMLLFALGAVLALALLQLFNGWLKASTVTGWQLWAQRRLLRSYANSSWLTQAAEPSGALQTYVGQAAAGSKGLLGALDVTAATGTLVVFATVAFIASPFAALALVVVGAVFIAVLRPLRLAAQAASGRAVRAQKQLATEVADLHELVREVRVAQASESVLESIGTSAGEQRRARRWSMALTYFGSVTYQVAGLLIVILLAWLASGRSDLDLARVGVAGLLLLRSLGYGQRVQAGLQGVANARPSIDEIALADQRFRERSLPRGTQSVERVAELKLTGVEFAYTEGQPALRSIDLAIAPGESLGVVGPSGSGKTTLINIVLGLVRPHAGRYECGGIPVWEIDEASWFRLVGFVPQQPRILRASVEENIRFFRPEITTDDVLRAAAMAGIHDEIAELPSGYDTQLARGARELSGGQTQRLGIARALAGKPGLLILDEPTSALDALSEARIQESLRAIRGSVTTVVIAHRVATVKDCDRLLVLDGGEVSELDSPSAVLSRNAYVRSASDLQAVPARAEEG